jgi:hypothetical protein
VSVSLDHRSGQAVLAGSARDTLAARRHEGRRRGDWLPRSGVGARAGAPASRARCIGDGTADTRRWSAGHTLPRWSVGARREALLGKADRATG